MNEQQATALVLLAEDKLTALVDERAVLSVNGGPGCLSQPHTICFSLEHGH
jgi:hypothetical protein